MYVVRYIGNLSIELASNIKRALIKVCKVIIASENEICRLTLFTASFGPFVVVAFLFSGEKTHFATDMKNT